jgi:prepilin-type processing-associated H-X9-DG protein
MRTLARIALVIAGLFLLACLGQAVPFDFAFALIFGWMSYLARVLPEVRINGEGVATALVCLVVFTAGSHAFLRWCSEQAGGAKGPVGRRWRWRWTAWLVVGLVLMFIAGLAAGGIAHQVGWLITSPEPIVAGDAGPAALRAQSTNNLKQMGLALYNYQQAVGTFPAGGTFDRQGRPLQSWQTIILPYLEFKDLSDRIDFGIPWDDPRNASAFQTTVNTYLFPTIREQKDPAGYALSHYAANARMLGGDVGRSPRDVTDGTSQTLMAGEVIEGFKPWGDPTNWRDPALGLNRSPAGFGSKSKGGVTFLFVDGSVRFIKDSIDPRLLQALSTPAGGEPVSSESY